jgi:hypothetical protein
LLDEDNNAYLADFGIAKHLDEWSGSDKTEIGVLVGSPAYASPEQLLADPVRPQTDIYCLGIMLYELLAGVRPFPGPSPILYIQQHLNEPLPSISEKNPALPPTLDPILLRATAKEPADRYPDVLSFLTALQPVLLGSTAPSTPIFLTPTPALATQELIGLENPYKGLRAFSEADNHNFFGRDNLVHELLGRIGESSNGSQDLSRFLAIVGPSGSGKSSVVKAGLLPALRQGGVPGSESWFIADMLPGANPTAELAAALLRVAAHTPNNLLEQLRLDEQGLQRVINQILPDDGTTELLLLIDQFEELFTLVANESVRAHFLDSLVTAVLDERSRLRLVITLRADFVDRPLQYVDFGELVRKRTEFVLPLNSDELEEAISRPVTQLGLTLEPGLAAQIMRDVGDEPGTLPLLQYALTELFERRQGAVLTRAAYEASGGVLGALGRRADEIYTRLDLAGQEAARQLFLRLITLGEGTEDTRRRVLRSELEELRITNDELRTAPSPLAAVVDRFGAARLLTFDRDPLTRAPTVEVAHEALLREWPRLRDWLAASRDDVRWQRMLAAATAEWQQAGQDESYLLRGSRLDQFESWSEQSQVALSGEERAFLEASLAARQQRLAAEEARRQRELETAQKLAQTERQRAEEQAKAAQRLRQRAAFLAGALAVAALLAVLAFTFARSASHNAELAAAREVDALTNAELAATRAAEALMSAGLAATREVEAINSAGVAAARQAEAEAEANLRATAEAIAIEEREAAEWQARLAFSRELVASAILNLEDDPELSILLAQHALTQAETLQAQEALHRALHSSHLLQRIPDREDRHFGLPVTISADGTLLAVGVYAGNFFDFQWQTEVRDAVTLELLYTLPGRALTYGLDDANRLATFTRDADALTVMIWDAAGQPVSSIALPINHRGPPVVSPDLAWLAYYPVGSATPVLVDLSTGEIVRELIAHWGSVFTGWEILCHNAGGAGGLVVLEVESGREVYNRPTRQGSAVAFSADGQQIAFAEANGAPVTIVDIASGQDVIALHGHTGQLAFAQFNAAGTRLVTIGLDSSAIIWDTSTGASLLRLGLDTSGQRAVGHVYRR